MSREQFILGKYAGLVFTLIVNLTAMTAVMYGVLFYMNAVAAENVRLSWQAPATDPRLLIAVVLLLAELMVVTALALFFSTFSSPLLSTVLTLGLWTAGHFNDDLRQFDQVVDNPVAAWVTKGLYYILPNLSPFDIKAEVVHGIAVPATHVAYTLAYAALYISILLLGATAIFRRRHFK